MLKRADQGWNRINGAQGLNTNCRGLQWPKLFSEQNWVHRFVGAQMGSLGQKGVTDAQEGSSGLNKINPARFVWLKRAHQGSIRFPAQKGSIKIVRGLTSSELK